MPDFGPIVTRSAAQTRALAAALAPALDAGMVLLLSGPLGAGKTQVVKGLAAGLGVDPHTVTSPTFTLVHVYACPPRTATEAPASATRGPAPTQLTHIDGYRLRDPKDALELGFEELVATPGSLTAIEWPERLALDLPVTLALQLDHLNPNEPESRRVAITRLAPDLPPALTEALRAHWPAPRRTP